MKKRTVILIICILVVIIGVVLCINQCGNSKTKQEKPGMTEMQAIKDDSAVPETSEAVSENRTEGNPLAESSSDEKSDVVETKSIADTIVDDTSETEGMASKESDGEKLIASGGIKKSDEDLYSSNSGGPFDQEIHPTNPPNEESETAPVLPDETLDHGEQESVPSAFELAQNDSTLDYEYYLNVMTPEEKQRIYEAAPSPQAFLSWVAELKAEYNEARKGKITDAEVGISLD